MRMTWPGRRELWPRSDEQQHPKPRHLLQGHREQLQRRRIGPMDILNNGEHRLSRRQALELSQKRRQRQLLALLRAQLWHTVTVARRQRQKVGQRQQYAVRISPHEQSFK